MQWMGLASLKGHQMGLASLVAKKWERMNLTTVASKNAEKSPLYLSLLVYRGEYLDHI